jgi:hypothetical protein
MEQVPVTSIELEHDGTLAVRPGWSDRSAFHFIYRDATGVEWRDADGAFYPYRLGGVDPLGWFKIIVAAARNELGVDLQVTQHTNWINVGSDLQSAILEETRMAQSNPSLERP